MTVSPNPMKRSIRIKKPIRAFLLFILLLSFFRFGAFADDIGFSPEVNGTLKTGKTFHIILSSTEPVSSLLLNISFDPDSVELKKVTAASGSAVRTSQKTGEADVIWSGKKALSSRLLTFQFKALKGGSTDIVITPLSAASLDARLIEFSSSAAMTVSVSGTSSSVSRSSSASSSSKSTASKKKGVSSSSPSNENNTSNESSPTQLVDLAAPSSRVPGIILTAVIAAVVIALVLVVGILIGRKTHLSIKKPPDTREDPTEDHEE